MASSAAQSVRRSRASCLATRYRNWLGFLIAYLLVTYLSVVLGELVPKALTLDRAETLAALVGQPIAVISTAFRPLVRILQGSALILLRPSGIREVVVGNAIRSPEELEGLVDEAEDAGVIPRAQEELLLNVFAFAQREVADVMVPAPEVVWFDANLTADETLDRALETPHERYPVGRGSLDQLAGIVHGRELIAAARTDLTAPIGPRAQPARVVPETMDLGALLRELRERRQQLAMVIDKYGSTAGIVTLEDILEEIVGEIEDEYDLPDDRLDWADDQTVLVAGSMTIDDFNETVGMKLPHDGPRSMAGLVFATLGRRPEPGDNVTLGSVRLSVDAVDRLRIKRLRVTLPPGVGA